MEQVKLLPRISAVGLQTNDVVRDNESDVFNYIEFPHQAVRLFISFLIYSYSADSHLPCAGFVTVL